MSFLDNLFGKKEPKKPVKPIKNKDTIYTAKDNSKSTVTLGDFPMYTSYEEADKFVQSLRAKGFNVSVYTFKTYQTQFAKLKKQGVLKDKF
jgi:cell division septation protein DedD